MMDIHEQSLIWLCVQTVALQIEKYTDLSILPSELMNPVLEILEKKYSNEPNKSQVYLLLASQKAKVSNLHIVDSHPRSFHILSKFSSLSNVSICNSPHLTSRNVQWLTSSMACNSLTHLNLSNCPLLDDFALKRIGKCVNLKHLNLSKCLKIRSRGLESLINIRRLSEIILLECSSIHEFPMVLSKCWRKTLTLIDISKTKCSLCTIQRL
eukprot:Sdes_comp13863_c0_seq1m3316